MRPCRQLSASRDRSAESVGETTNRFPTQRSIIVFLDMYPRSRRRNDPSKRLAFAWRFPRSSFAVHGENRLPNTTYWFRESHTDTSRSVFRHCPRQRRLRRSSGRSHPGGCTSFSNTFRPGFARAPQLVAVSRRPRTPSRVSLVFSDRSKKKKKIDRSARPPDSKGATEPAPPHGCPSGQYSEGRVFFPRVPQKTRADKKIRRASHIEQNVVQSSAITRFVCACFLFSPARRGR